MSSEHVLELTDANFDQEVLQPGVVALVDFWGDGCVPCQMLAPAIEELAADFEGRVKVGKLDTGSSRDVAIRYGIQMIPTLLIFKGGEMVGKLVGLQQKAELAKLLEGALAG
jgi:thioredoxin 1